MFAPLKRTFLFTAANIVTLVRSFKAVRSTYRHASRSCYAPLTWDADVALKEQTRDGVDGSQMFNVCLTVAPTVAQTPPYIQEYLALQRVLPPRVCLDRPANKDGDKS